MFKLSQRSINNLKGTKSQLQDVVSRAIQLTEVDFVVIEGLRSIARQQELVRQGASQTMNSKHITGDAVDLAAWNETIRWEMPFYFKIAEAMRDAAREQNVGIKWGGSWIVPDIRSWQGTMQQAYDAYITNRHMKGLKPFIDGPHFELI